MCTRLHTKKAELRTTKLDVLSEAQESSILEKSTESLQTTAGSRRLADFFFLHYSCLYFLHFSTKNMYHFCNWGMGKGEIVSF